MNKVLVFSDVAILAAAVAAHEANREYCVSIGDDTQVPWDDAPDWQKEGALAGVKFHINNPDAEDSASHDNWVAQKLADGWVLGEEKDEEEKTHPCMVPFDELPEEQQHKDVLFKETVWIGLEAAKLAEESADTEKDPDDLPHVEKIGILVGILGGMDQDDDDLWNRDGLPSLPGLRGFAPFHVDDDMRRECWTRYNEGNTEAEINPVEEPVEKAQLETATVTVDGVEYEVTRADFALHGVWWEGKRKISTMWSCLVPAVGGTKFYQNVPQVAAKKLPVYPLA